MSVVQTLRTDHAIYILATNIIVIVPADIADYKIEAVCDHLWGNSSNSNGYFSGYI